MPAMGLRAIPSWNTDSVHRPQALDHNTFCTSAFIGSCGNIVGNIVGKASNTADNTSSDAVASKLEAMVQPCVYRHTD